MSSQSTEFEQIPLGQFLREARDKKGLDLAAIVEETKISINNLRAIEDNDFGALPAEAFTRGIYTLYAKALSLDPAEVLQKYAQEKPKPTKPGGRIEPSGTVGDDVGSMAQRPTTLPFSTFGLILLLLLLFGGFLCWYFSWNPATYLSQKLRGIQDGPQQVEQAFYPHSSPSGDDNFFDVAKDQQVLPTTSLLFNYPSTAIAGILQPYTPEENPLKPTKNSSN